MNKNKFKYKGNVQEQILDKKMFGIAITALYFKSYKMVGTNNGEMQQ